MEQFYENAAVWPSGIRLSDGAFRYTEQMFKTMTIEELVLRLQWILTRAPRPVVTVPLSLHFEIPIDRLDLQGRTI